MNHLLKISDVCVKQLERQELWVTLEKLRVSFQNSGLRFNKHPFLQMKKKLNYVTLTDITSTQAKTHLGGFMCLIFKNNRALKKLRLHNLKPSQKFIKVLNTTSIRDFMFSGQINKLEKIFSRNYYQKQQEMVYTNKFIRNIEKLVIYDTENLTHLYHYNKRSVKPASPQNFEIDFQKLKQLKVLKFVQYYPQNTTMRTLYTDHIYLMLRKSFFQLLKCQSLEFVSLVPVHSQFLNHYKLWKVFEILADVICIQSKIKIKHLELLQSVSSILKIMNKSQCQ
eukprot:403337339